MSDDATLAALLEKRAKLERQLASMVEIQRNIEAIDRVLKMMNYTPQKNGNSAPDVSGVMVVPEVYTPNLKWEEKCAWILTALQTAYAGDVASEIMRQEPSITIKEAEAAAKYNLSKMYREGKITVIGKDGKKYKYSIKQEEEMK